MIRRLAGASAIGWAALYVAGRASRGAIRTPGHARAPDDAPLISVVVPARDEERDVEQTLRSLSAQRYPSLEIIAVDDRSRDGTRAAIARAAADDPRIVVVGGSEPPDGWLGKPWACAQAVERAHGEWLCFTDADVRFEPDALASALAFALVEGRGGVTLSPLLVCSSFWERTVQPVATMAILALVAPPVLSQHPDAPVSLAAGAFMLVRRDLYERAGGHAAVRDRVADDLQLARAVKRAGACSCSRTVTSCSRCACTTATASSGAVGGRTRHTGCRAARPPRSPGRSRPRSARSRHRSRSWPVRDGRERSGSLHSSRCGRQTAGRPRPRSPTR